MREGTTTVSKRVARVLHRGGGSDLKKRERLGGKWEKALFKG